MAHIQRTANGKWECCWSFKDGEGKRRFQKRRFDTKREADALRREKEDRAANKQSTDQRPGKLTLGVWAERWFHSLEGKKKVSTLRGYRKVLDATVLPQLGNRPVTGITTWDVEQFINYLSSTGKAAPTVKGHYGVLRSALNYAARHNAIPVNPCIGAELPADHRTDNKRPQALSPEQVAALAARLDKTEPVYGLLIRFMAYSGLRAGEVAGLHIGDLDLLRKRLYVRRTRTKVKGGWEVTTTKNGKERIVKMPPWLCDRLAAYLAEHPHGPNGTHDLDQPLWPGRKANDAERFRKATGGLDYDKPWERDAFYKRQFRPALAAAELPAIRLHDLRHTAATIMLMSGKRTHTVASMLGHSEQVLRDVYAHWIDDDDDLMDDIAEPLQKEA